ncbi:hypothetical protein DTO021D3_4523 [Paecilomyces variotii]|nr:hypothetical protein DTO032I3_3642 [Paecilomyces variotii]KAJ9278614.1 hypothetical protein DTO021D3_4523 [Paecilomyces variotii]KAJ9344588.1 hypothetical protein DTO027B6_2770 [Paecilomyces variotii]KAJ9352868.1 hypothetical protein DTO027B9_5616 [Paecilomyces variotii]KAJ9380126.1 hypothetical protein DTO032I4_6816 [Paecilomyces variotii]
MNTWENLSGDNLRHSNAALLRTSAIDREPADIDDTGDACRENNRGISIPFRVMDRLPEAGIRDQTPDGSDESGWSTSSYAIAASRCQFIKHMGWCWKLGTHARKPNITAIAAAIKFPTENRALALTELKPRLLIMEGAYVCSA